MFKVITYTISGKITCLYSHVNDKEGIEQIALLAEIFENANQANSEKAIPFNIFETDNLPENAQCII